MMIDTQKLDRVIDDCLDEMGEEDAQHVVLVVSGNSLAVGTNIANKDFVCNLLYHALRMVNRQVEEMSEIKGNA